HLLGLVKKFSPDVYNKLEQIIIDSSHQVKMDILERVSKGSAEKYNNNLREFVIQRMVEIGVFKKKETPRIDEAITFLTKTLKIPADLQKKVIKRFNNILEGEAVDIAISYEGKPDPFWAVFQEMLIRSGYGNIRSGMAMGENISPEDSMEEKNKKVKEALENIRDQIESEMYLEVKLLRVNSVYFTEKEFDGILQQLKFYDETNLKDRIASIQYIEIKGNRSMEVYIPLKRGYIDWNTSQAIWRINQELRPEDYLKQWSIDKIFLEALYEAYLAAA
ncbi:MAG: hypothetical protein KKA19_01600, partial [Candidatus Margulisbacteria bacterium]|nr:hypothetical protein [Candidatus Margulisiibacteriota bacterium]